MNSLSLAQVRDLMVPLPTLPTEVIEEVIDQAHDDPLSLKQLTLICKPLLTRARIHLFTSIVIRDVEQMASSGEFLDSHPWVLPLVHKVTLPVKSPNDKKKPNFPILDMIPLNFFTRLPKLNAWGMNASSPYTSARLSLHRSLLLCYRTYGQHIQELELACTPVQGVSHFIELVSAFTALRRLTCSDIPLPSRKEHQSPLDNSAILDKLAKPLKIQHLNVSTSVDIRLVEYLLGSSAATLGSLSIALKDPICPDNSWETYYERLEELMDRLSKLSSMSLVILGAQEGSYEWEDFDSPRDIAERIRWATRALENVRRAQLSMTDVRVQFNSLWAVAQLGRPLSCGGPLLEACQALEASLLAFPPNVASNLEFHWEESEWFRHRAGRFEFWFPTITSAFPNVNQRGLHTLPRAGRLGPLGHEHMVNCLVASPDSEWFVTGSDDGTIIVWGAEQCTIVHEWLAHCGPVDGLGISPHGRRIVSAGGLVGETLIVWDIGDGVRKITILATIDPERREQTTTVACTWSPDGTLIASARRDATVCVWNAFTFQQLSAVSTDSKASFGFRSGRLQWSSDSRYLAWCYGRSELQVGRGDDEWAVWDPLRGEPPKRFPSGQTRRQYFDIHVFSFDPQGKRAAIGLKGNQITREVRRSSGVGGYSYTGYTYYIGIWDIMSCTALVLLEQPNATTDVSFSPDGRSLLSVSKGGWMEIWDTESWRKTASLEEDGPEWPEACFSPDGKYVAIASGDCETRPSMVRLWRIDDMSCAVVVTEHKNFVCRLAFSPDGEFLASGDGEGVVHICRLSPTFIGR